MSQAGPAEVQRQGVLLLHLIATHLVSHLSPSSIVFIISTLKIDHSMIKKRWLKNIVIFIQTVLLKSIILHQKLHVSHQKHFFNLLKIF